MWTDERGTRKDGDARIFLKAFVDFSHGFCQVGLDNAGKTTILYAMKLGEVVSTVSRTE